MLSKKSSYLNNSNSTLLLIVFFSLLLIFSQGVFASNYNIIVSDSSDLSNSVLLESSTLSGLVYIQVEDDATIDFVDFYLDARSGIPYKTAYSAPFGMAGTNKDGSVKAIDTTKLDDGSHYIHATKVFLDGSVLKETAYFIIDNTLVPEVSTSNYNIIVSGNSDLSNSVLLESSTLSGLVYIQVEDDTTIDFVDFHLDARSGIPYKTAYSAPFGMAGTNKDGSVKAIDTTKLDDGSHYIHATKVFLDGSVLKETAYFIINNTLLSQDNVVIETPNEDLLPPQDSLPETSPFTLVVNQPDRRLLQSSILSGEAYIELVSDIEIKLVAFYLDASPDTADAPRHTEQHAPYDFVGFNFFNITYPFKTDSVSDGTHTIFAVITLNDDTTVTVKSDFYILNSSAEPETIEESTGTEQATTSPSEDSTDTEQTPIDTNEDSLTNDSSSNSGKTLISWSAPNKRENGLELLSSEIAQYIVYYGTQSNVYTDSVTITKRSNDVLITSVSIDNLDVGIVYYFSGTTVDLNGLSSTHSGEISRLIQP